ncbi:hypothetical protein FGO68_gene6415 [Halteria grandinella]|uniref:Uncharacterized protein n=1 Tax=Halteria grandinella TaxID=5974 RepID=A0A8J8T012_HALGN|nr:hypothetical protein FGO68_gene6415 [Halteria grandinella]
MNPMSYYIKMEETTIDFIINCGLVEVSIYLLFLALAIRKCTKAHIMPSIYLRITIAFIGMSIVISFVRNLAVAITGKEEDKVLKQLVTGEQFQTLEKIGIMVDVAGLALQSIRQIYFEDLKAQKDQMRFIKILLYVCVGIIVVIHAIYSSLYSFSVLENTDNSSIELSLSLLSIFYTFLSNTAILVAYMAVFILQLNFYLEKKRTNVRNHFTEEDQALMRKELLNLLLLFLSITQLYIYRNVREVMHQINVAGDFAKWDHDIYYCCKILMILGICISLYVRIMQNYVSELRMSQRQTAALNRGSVVSSQTMEEIEEYERAQTESSRYTEHIKRQEQEKVEINFSLQQKATFLEDFNY